MHDISKIEFLLKRHLKPAIFRVYCLLGKVLSPLTNRTLQKNRISRILIFQGGGIGDLIRVFPLLKSLREEFPLASVTILSPFARDFFELYPRPDLIAETIVIDVAKRHKSVLNKLRLALQLRKKIFDLIICPQSGLGMIEFSIMSFLIGAPYRIGFDKKGSGFLYTTKPDLRENRSIYEQNTNLLRVSGINACFDRDYFTVPEEDLNYAHSFLSENGAKAGDLIFSISPVVVADTDSKSPQHDRSLAEPRMWPEQCYVDLIIQILQTYRAKVVLLGNRFPDGKLSEFLAGSRDPNLISAVGKTTIRQAAALIKLSGILISNDSGPLHIALALRTPCVGIFGSTSPVQQLVGDRKDCAVIWKGLECSPCYVQEPIPHIDCPNDLICLKSITVKDVMGSITRLITA